MVKQTSILWTVVMGLGILSWVVVVAGIFKQGQNEITLMTIMDYFV